LRVKNKKKPHPKAAKKSAPKKVAKKPSPPKKKASAKPAKPAAKKAAPAKPVNKTVPQGYAWVNPYFTVSDVASAIAFYEKAFGMKKVMVMPGPGGKIMHGEMAYEGVRIMMGPEAPEMGAKSARQYGGSPMSLYLYCKDVDALFARAVAAGATGVKPPADQFYGDRTAFVTDPEGYGWGLATHVRDVSPADMAKAAEAAHAAAEKGDHTHAHEHDSGASHTHSHEHEHGGSAHNHEHTHGHAEHGHGHEAHHGHEHTHGHDHGHGNGGAHDHPSS
jgi:PhnB protein